MKSMPVTCVYKKRIHRRKYPARNFWYANSTRWNVSSWYPFMEQKHGAPDSDKRELLRDTRISANYQQRAFLPGCIYSKRKNRYILYSAKALSQWYTMWQLRGKTVLARKMPTMVLQKLWPLDKEIGPERIIFPNPRLWQSRCSVKCKRK